MNKYDMLLGHLIHKIKDLYMNDLGSFLYAVGASHKLPDPQEIEFNAFISAALLLHSAQVDVTSNHADIIELKADLLDLFSKIDGIQERLKEMQTQHNTDITINMFSKNTNFEA